MNLKNMKKIILRAIRKAKKEEDEQPQVQKASEEIIGKA